MHSGGAGSSNGMSKSLISSIYKHPQVSDSTFLLHISDMADKQFLCNDHFTFIGDMNCCPRKSDVTKTFCDIYDLKNLIVSPTYHKGNNPTLLDGLLVSKPRRFAKTLNCECILSDFHNFVGAATMWPLCPFMSREYLMMCTRHRGLQVPCEWHNWPPCTL